MELPAAQCEHSSVLGVILLALAPVSSCCLAWLLTLRAIERGRAGEPAGRAQALVVLGAAVRHGRPCPELEARLDRAAELWRGASAPLVVCSGSRTETAIMRRALTRAGVPPEAIEEDPGGVSSRATVLAARRHRSVIFVSSPWHAHRLRTEASRRGLAARVCVASRSPVESRPGPRRRQLAREVVASWAYALSGTLAGTRDGYRAPVVSDDNARLLARGEA
jgi:uncharacterized SAM-binding protein YcdF (DUF218 family)